MSSNGSIITRSGDIKSIPKKAIEIINNIEVQIFEAEAPISDSRWKQSKIIAELNDEGFTTRVIASEWIKAETGEPYGKSHVIYTIKSWRVFGHLSDQERPRWNVAYNSDEVRNPPHVSQNSGNNEWYTPPEYIEAARAVMGNIDTDPASSDIANETVQADTHYTADDDGLAHDWRGRVWMNPPYAQPLINDFCQKFAMDYRQGFITKACVLVNNATDTKWYQSLLEHAGAVCFVFRRIRFIDEQGNPSGAPLQGQTVLYFGDNTDLFTSEFSQFGRVLYATG